MTLSTTLQAFLSSSTSCLQDPSVKRLVAVIQDVSSFFKTRLDFSELTALVGGKLIRTNFSKSDSDSWFRSAVMVPAASPYPLAVVHRQFMRDVEPVL